jgi:hypothetical protein
MFLINEKIIIFIFFVIILFLSFIIYLFIPNKIECYDLKIYKKILLSKALINIKEGDLVLFSSNRHNLITRTIGNDTFSHIGIVIQNPNYYNDINNKYNIYEMVKSDIIKPNTDRIKNIVISNLEDRILNYNGNVYIASLIKPLNDIQLYKLNQFIKKDFKFSTNTDVIFNLFSNKLSNNRRFCSELIADLLSYINVSNKPIKSKKYNLQDEIINLCNDIIYYKPIHIIPDKLLIDRIDYKDNFISYCKKEV